MKTLRPFLILAALIAALVPSFASAQGAPFCGPGQRPFYQFGFASLANVIGPDMGPPTECEHPNASNGDTLQHTVNGLAFYRASTNTPTYTDGWNHFALTASGPVRWTGSSIDPPGTAVANHDADVAYLNAMVPVVTNAQQVQNKIKEVFQQFALGNYDNRTTILLLTTGVVEWNGVIANFNALHPTPKYAHVHQTFASANQLWGSSVQNFINGLRNNDGQAIRRASTELQRAQDLYDAGEAELNSIPPG